MLQEAKTLIEKAWMDRRLLKNDNTKEAISKIIDILDQGNVRAAEPSCTGEWLVNEWIKKAIILYFQIQECKLIEVGPFEFHDKIPLRKGMTEKTTRIVPHAVVRYGSYIDKEVTLMPSFVNIGAHIGSGTMVDSFATIGSCAQIEKNVHVGGGAIIGGVLEPPQAKPVLVEEGCFIGSQCNIVGGIHIERESILSANCVIAQTTKIIDVTGDTPQEFKGVVPEKSIVVPGSYTKKFKSGNYQVNCVLIVGKRKNGTDLQNSLKNAILEFGLAV